MAVIGKKKGNTKMSSTPSGLAMVAIWPKKREKQKNATHAVWSGRGRHQQKAIITARRRHCCHCCRCPRCRRCHCATEAIATAIVITATANNNATNKATATNVIKQLSMQQQMFQQQMQMQMAAMEKHADTSKKYLWQIAKSMTSHNNKRKRGRTDEEDDDSLNDDK